MDVICDMCGANAELVDNAVIYGKSYGKNPMMWWCPKCGAYVGTHPNLAPLGSLVGNETREARKTAHHLFDQLWNGREPKFDSRSKAYRWLAQALDISAAEAHIGMMSVDQCTAVVNAVLDLMVQGEQNNEKEGSSQG